MTGARRLWHAGTIAAAVVGLACLFCARHTSSGTFDESNHLAAGLEWWQFGTYTMWTENPPLSRLAIAALPYLHGMRLPPRDAWEPKTHQWDRSWEMGNDLLYAGDGFEANLARARLGTLPFFLLALACVWLLADGRRRPGAGLLAVALTATLPALIGHGALATTDVTFAATFLLAALALQRWFEAPTRGRAVALGAAFALTLLSKFSVLLFFPVTVVAFVVARRLAGDGALPAQQDGRRLGWASLARQVAIMAATAFVVTWAGYRFSVGRVGDLTPEVGGWLHLLPPLSQRTGLVALVLRTPVPMPELLHGLRFLIVHDITGHDAYLLGKTAEHGFLAFYPVALLVKTPLPFLLLGLASVAVLARRRLVVSWHALALILASAGILLLSLRSHVNLGIRHVFVVLPLAAVVTARVTDAGLASLAGRTRHAVALVVAVLVVGQAGIAVAARRTELGYFNALAAGDPAAILLDSDLDWGQDLFLLRDEVRARGIDDLKIGFFGTLRLCQHGLPPLEALRPGVPTTGWIAVSENYYRHRSTFKLLKQPCDPKSTYADGDFIPPRGFAWLQAYRPVVVVGSSVRLYHIEHLVAADDHAPSAR